ncbi:MAG: RCC1 domain-containing protein [Cetobacterium sp.]
MFITDKDIWKNKDEPNDNKIGVSADLAKKLDEEVKNLYNSLEEKTLMLDMLMYENNKDRLKLSGTFPVFNTAGIGLKIGHRFVYHSEIYEYIGSTKIKKIQTGERHAVVLEDNGDIFVWGRNTEGQLGINTITNVPFPTKMDLSCFNGEKIVDIFASDLSTWYLTENGSVYTVGYNNVGNLGHGNTTALRVPKKIEFEFASRITDIFMTTGCSVSQSVIIQCENGELYGVGDNTHSQLLTGDAAHKNIPTQISYKFPSRIKKIAIGCIKGCSNTVILCEDGSVLLAGYNADGQLGIIHGNTTTNIYNLILNIKPGSSVTDVFAHAGMTYLVVDARTLYVTGYNISGAGGTGGSVRIFEFTKSMTFDSPIVKVDGRGTALNEEKCYVLLKNGDIYSSGYNAQGCLGQLHDGVNRYQFNKTANQKPATDISAFSYRSVLIQNFDGSLSFFGNNDQFQGGIGSTNTSVNSMALPLYDYRTEMPIEYLEPNGDFIKL